MKNRLHLIVIYLLLTVFIMTACEKKQPLNSTNSLIETTAATEITEIFPEDAGENEESAPLEDSKTAQEKNDSAVPQMEVSGEGQEVSPYQLVYHPSKDKSNGVIYLEHQADGSWKMTGEEYYQGTLRTVLYIALGVFSACVLFLGSYIACRLIGRRER